MLPVGLDRSEAEAVLVEKVQSELEGISTPTQDRQGILIFTSEAWSTRIFSAAPSSRKTTAVRDTDDRDVPWANSTIHMQRRFSAR